MKVLYKASEWQGTSNNWYVNDVSDLTSIRSLWWTPVRMLGITPCEYVLMLKEKFNANRISFDKILIFSFATQADARKYKNWINAEARKRNFVI